MNHSARRINQLALALKAERYLEIGVEHGATFFNVNIKEKTAVDPNFMFDPAKLEPGSDRFFSMRSDEFFRSHERETFDLIFIDGLHTFAQAYRDFINSLLLGHANTLWLLDDTVPNDIFSAWPDSHEAISSRHEAGIEGVTWHGDVYKVVFAIHDFYPLLSYATITAGGNPQTLVWRAARSDFNPRFNSLEAISRLGWFDFRKNFAILKPVDEAAGLRLPIEALGQRLEHLTPDQR